MYGGHDGDWDEVRFGEWRLMLPSYTANSYVRSYRDGADVLRLRSQGCPEDVLRAMVTARAESSSMIEPLMRGRCALKH
jgi:hypothetical protein